MIMYQPCLHDSNKLWIYSPYCFNLYYWFWLDINSCYIWHHWLQVLKLKEQLSEAEKEIQRLLERVPSNSSSSSQSQSQSHSMEAVDPPFFGDFGVDGYDDDVYYVPESHYINGMEWINLYMWTNRNLAFCR